MNLLIDIGNSRLKWACHTSTDWITGALDMSQHSFVASLDQYWSDWQAPGTILVCSVADNEINQQLGDWIKHNWGTAPEFISTPTEQNGLLNGYEDPKQLGTDRWLAMLGAMDSHEPPFCVIACGTAVTLDVVNEQRQFCGGLIFPGLRLLRQGLVNGTAGIDSVDDNPDKVPGRSTAQGAAAGTLMGLVGAIRFIMDDYVQRFGSKMVFIITGGDAELIQSRLHRDCIVIPDLTLKGLALQLQEKE